MGFVKVGDVLSKVAQTSGDPEVAEASYILEIVELSLQTFLDKNLFKQVSPLKYSKGVLVLATSSSVVAHELNLRKVSLINLLNKKLGSKVVTKIIYRVGVTNST